MRKYWYEFIIAAAVVFVLAMVYFGHERQQCIEITGGTGFYWSWNSGCLQQNPWTGQFERVM